MYGAHRPFADINPATHPHLYYQPYQPRNEHLGQAWMHGNLMEQPTLPVDAAEDLAVDGGDVSGGAIAPAAYPAACDDGVDSDVESGDSCFGDLDDDGDDRVADDKGVSLVDAQEQLKRWGGAAPGSSPFFSLNIGGDRGVHFHEFINYDIMHAGSKVLDDVVLGTLLGTRWSDKVREIEKEQQAGPRFSEEELQRGPGRLPPNGLDRFQNALFTTGSLLGGDAARLKWLLDPSKKRKAHTHSQC